MCSRRLHQDEAADNRDHDPIGRRASTDCMPEPRDVRRRDARIAYYERCASRTDRSGGAGATRRIGPPAIRPDGAAWARGSTGQRGRRPGGGHAAARRHAHPRHGTRGTRWRGPGERAMTVQDDDVRAARSRIATGRLRGGARSTRERLPDFRCGRLARAPAFVDPGSDAAKHAGHPLDRSLHRPYPDGCATADRDRLREGRVERMKDTAP